MAAIYVPVQRKAFGEQVTEYLRDAIVQGELPIGMRLVEEHLANQFGVSRGPIRDALRRLEQESLVESRGTGSYVVGITEADIDELYSLRQAVESLAADLAMDRTTEEGWAQMALLVRTLEEAADAQDHAGFAAADIQFHSRIYTLSGHRRLADVWQQYAPILTTLLRTTVFKDADLHESAAKHRLLLELMTAGDKPAVAAELKVHLEGSHQRMLKSHRSSQAGETG